MSTASAAPGTLARVEEAIAFLREAGRGDEADAVESLVPSPKRRRLPPTPPPSEQGLIPIAEAAARLGLSRNAVQRRIDSGLLDGVRDERNGYRFVTRASVEKLIDTHQMIASVAVMAGDSDEDHDPDSLLAQMLRAADLVDPLDDGDQHDVADGSR